MKNLNTLCALLLTVTVAAAAETTFNPAAQPAPRTELPALPADGSGIYRLTLVRAAGPQGLHALIEVTDGKPRSGVVLRLQQGGYGGCWWPLDVTTLACDAGRLRGTVKLTVMPPFGRENEEFFQRQPNKHYKEDFVFRPVGEGTLALDLDGTKHTGSGTYALTLPEDFPFRSLHINDKPDGAISGTVQVVRTAPLPLGADWEGDLLGSLMLSSAGELRNVGGNHVRLRFAVREGRLAKAVAYGFANHKVRVAPFGVTSVEGAVEDVARATVSIKGARISIAEDAQPVDLAFTIVGRIGPWVWGTATCTSADAEVTVPMLGSVQAITSAPLPIDLPGPVVWDVPLDREAVPVMTARALTESLTPVMPGEPGETGFWTWRKHMSIGGGTVFCIHPPTFDLNEIVGAASYRFELVGRKGEDRIDGCGDGVVQGKQFSFVAEKPWASLAPVWGELIYGQYQLTVIPLDGSGEPISTAMTMNIVDKAGARTAISLAERGLSILKRPPFSGPYRDRARDYRTAALQFARILRDDWYYLQMRGAARGIQPWTTYGSDASFGAQWAACLWASLSLRGESSDAAERQWAELMVPYWEDEMRAHLQGRDQVTYNYQGQTPLTHWSIAALCDAYVQTGVEAFKELALQQAAGLRDLQLADGSFATYLGTGGRFWGMIGDRPREEWTGSIKKLPYYPTFSSVELLYALGRIRRDLGTDAFAEVETKAYEWAMEHAVKGRFWPLHVNHSACHSYPVTMHPVTAFYFCRYLLECAPEERRDLDLAAQVARWGEDFRIDWYRLPCGPGEQIYPRIAIGDRELNHAIGTSMTGAIVFEELAQATGDALWRAKGEALANAVTWAISPDASVAHQEMVSARDLRNVVEGNRVFMYGWTSHLMREYAQLREGDGQ